MQSKWKTLIVSALVGLLVLGGLTGCARTEAVNAENGELSIYYLAEDQNVKSYITSFTNKFPEITVSERSFEDSAQMDEVVANELNAGKGPDVIIFSIKNSLDVLRLAKSGAFACLDESVKADEELLPQNYLQGALDAGKMDGKQYIMPLTFRLPVVFYDEVPDLGLQGKPIITFDQLASALDTNLTRFAKDENHGAVVYTSFFVPLMAADDAIVLTDNNRKVEYDDARLEQMLSVMQKMNGQVDKISSIIAKYGGKDIDVVGRFALDLDNPADLVHRTWLMNNYYANSQAEDFHVSAISQGEDGEVSAVLNSYGAVTKNADSKAYDFLRIAMDTSLVSNKNAAYSLPLRRDALWMQIGLHKTATSTFQSKDGPVNMGGLPNALEEDLKAILNGVTKVKIFNTRVSDILIDSFYPYLEETKPYEDCLKDFKQKMELYATE